VRSRDEQVTPASVDDRALMTIRAEIHFFYDARGRMLGTNEPDSRPAPRLFVGRTMGGHVVRFGATVPDDLARELEAIVQRHADDDGLAVPAPMRAALRAGLERQEPIKEEGGGPAYRFPASFAQPDDAVEVTEANLAIVRETHPWLYRDLSTWGPCFAVFRDGLTAAICHSSRIGAQAMEAGVFTLPAYRGRGYAVAVTASWGAAVSASGRVPIYSTAWTNVASQGVARRLGLRMFGTDASWT
jgi:hypothetical protein